MEQELTENMEEILARHRRERKELQAKIQEMKKNAPKSDKKKRKEAMERVLQLEHELEHRQAEELKAAHAKPTAATDEKQTIETTSATATTKSNNAIDSDTAGHNDESEADTPGGQRISKAQKRRDKKAREARQLEEEVAAAAADAHNTPKAIEGRTIRKKLRTCNLAEHPILSDGNCLYNSVRHQLQMHGLGAYTAEALRHRTADYMLENKESFVSYLSETDYPEHCDKIRNTTLWGGQLELMALSRVFGVPIEVLQAEGPSCVLGENEKGPKLVITYHRHMYSMGEHYNSTQPLVAAHDNQVAADSDCSNDDN